MLNLMLRECLGPTAPSAANVQMQPGTKTGLRCAPDTPHTKHIGSSPWTEAGTYRVCLPSTLLQLQLPCLVNNATHSTALQVKATTTTPLRNAPTATITLNHEVDQTPAASPPTIQQDNCCCQRSACLLPIRAAATNQLLHSHPLPTTQHMSSHA
jgi:hypothetical protein